MKKIVVSGSASLQTELKDLVENLKNKYIVLDYPKAISIENFENVYPNIHKKFYQNICDADILLLANYDKKGIKGYIGPAGFAELSFAVTQNLIYNKNIEVYILQMPSKKVQCYEEISLWLSLGWVKLW